MLTGLRSNDNSMSQQRSQNTTIIIADILMMILLLANLSLIVFDWLFMTAIVKLLLSNHLPGFYAYYDQHIHQNFLSIDLIFVGIFVIELLVRWAIAIARRTYKRWFFYPIAHWYDVLGCIPIASFRFFRILRVISILYRLQRLSIIDLRKTYIFRVVKKYYQIIMEEISDSVLIKFIEGVQKELMMESAVTDRIIAEVITPRKGVLIDWLSGRIAKAISGTYEEYREDIHLYLEHLVGESLKGNKELAALKQVPVVGNFISKSLEKTVTDVALSSVNGLMKDMAGGQHHTLFHNITEHTVEGLMTQVEQDHLSAATREVLVESLELIKERIKVQQWKLRAEL